MTNEEKEIIIACQSGQREMFGLLYDGYVKKIYAFVYAKTSNRETAEDIVSQTFFKALSSINSFDIDKGTFQAWIYTIARNCTIDHYRQQKNNINLEDVWDLAGENDIETQTDAKQHLDQVREYLKTLKSEQREIIIMRIWQEMSYKEIAEIMNKSEAACKMTFSRAIGELRQVMPFALWIAVIINNLSAS